MKYSTETAAQEFTYSMVDGERRRVAELIGVAGFLYLCRGACWYFPLAERLTGHGIITISSVRKKDRELVRLVGIPAYINLLESFGGRKIYFPRRDTILRPVRDRCIRAAYNAGGQTVAQIASDHGVTADWVQKLCSGLPRESR